MGGPVEEQKQSLEAAFDQLNLTPDQLEWQKDSRPPETEAAKDFRISREQA